MSRSVVSSLKHEAEPSVLGLNTTRIVNCVSYLKNLTVYLSILTLIFSLQDILARKIVEIFSRVCIRYTLRHSMLNINLFCIFFMNY